MKGKGQRARDTKRRQTVKNPVSETSDHRVEKVCVWNGTVFPSDSVYSEPGNVTYFGNTVLEDKITLTCG